MDDALATELLESALQIVDGTLEYARSAEADRQGLRTKVSEQERVILEKVADASRHKLSDTLVQQTVRRLVDCAFLPAHSAEKLASQLTSDPNQALFLVQRLTHFGPAHEEGAGSKSAAHLAPAADSDGWNTVVHKGAA